MGDHIGFTSEMFGDGLNPCAKCDFDCLDNMKHVQCVVCDNYYHKECTDLSDDEYQLIKKKSRKYICCDKCYNRLLPFSHGKLSTLVQSEIFVNSIKSYHTVNVNASDDLIHHNPPTDSSFIDPNKFVTYDKFLDINCDFLNPNDFNDEHLGDKLFDLSIFHNNIRSLSKNFDSLCDIFHNCSSLPDILALSETRLSCNKNIPTLDNYNFECVNSPSAAGGVGAYISDRLTYSVRNDLSLNLSHCEDLWLNITLNDNDSSLSKKCIVVGIIFRHPGHNYETFTKKLCMTLNCLNESKTDYYLAGDFNIDLLKYNLASNVTLKTFKNHYKKYLNCSTDA